MNKELQDIVAYFDENKSGLVKTVLATVVDVKGSSYRLPGARMLIGENGEMLGTVSGGCLEADVLERAQKVLQTVTAEIFTYDTTKNDDSVFSLNMGCRGVVRILLEPVNSQSIFLNICQRALNKKERQFVGTFIAAKDLPETSPGGKIFYGELGHFSFENLPKSLENLTEFADECLKFFNQKDKAGIKNFKVGEETFEFFFENINPPLDILIFGAGADAVPLVEAAKNLGWNVSVIDHRAAFASKERFPKANRIILSRHENLAENLTVHENTVAVVMTHNYEHDKNILRFLLNSKAVYVGALGPKRRAENILREWREESADLSAEQLKKLYAPVGLDIGADTPEAIALSIVAEIQSVVSERGGGFLRERKTSIYERNVV